MPRRSRVRAGELLISRWRLPTWWVLILPLLVILKRFLAPDLVFILDILLSFTAPGRIRSPFVGCARRARGSHLGLPRHVRPGRPRGAPSIRRRARAQGQSRDSAAITGRYSSGLLPSERLRLGEAEDLPVTPKSSDLLPP